VETGALPWFRDHPDPASMHFRDPPAHR